MRAWRGWLSSALFLHPPNRRMLFIWRNRREAWRQCVGGRAPAQWLDFSANLRPEGPPAWVMDAMQRALQEMRYYPELTMRRAKQGLAAYARVPEACILPTAGGAAGAAEPAGTHPAAVRHIPDELDGHCRQLHRDIGRVNRLLYVSSGLMLALIVLAAVLL